MRRLRAAFARVLVPLLGLSAGGGAIQGDHPAAPQGGEEGGQDGVDGSQGDRGGEVHGEKAEMVKGLSHYQLLY